VKHIPPGGTCAACWEALAAYGSERWEQAPVAIVGIDLHAADQKQGRQVLHWELLALAGLAARYPEEFRELMESEKAFAALAGTMPARS
jgi:hypothetical protein